MRAAAARARSGWKMPDLAMLAMLAMLAWRTVVC
jgi:hypothetical protein